MAAKKTLDEIVLALRRAWYRLLDGCPVRMGGGQYRCDPENLNFWDKVNGCRWEPETFRTLDRLLTPDSIYCDIGAWIGPTVLYAARRCRQVYCFEPDRVAYAALLDNIRLNALENVLPFNLALAAESGLKRMASPRGKRGDSMTSLLVPEGRRGMEVLCLQWSRWLELVNTPVFDVIKMDVEGGEFTLLPTMGEYLQQHRPHLYLSLHPHLLPEGERQAAMTRVVGSLAMYGSCVDKEGQAAPLGSLLEGSRMHKGGTYLLYPA